MRTSKVKSEKKRLKETRAEAKILLILPLSKKFLVCHVDQLHKKGILLHENISRNYFFSVRSEYIKIHAIDCDTKVHLVFPTLLSVNR
jgi:hypothetical protein